MLTQRPFWTPTRTCADSVTTISCQGSAGCTAPRSAPRRSWQRLVDIRTWTSSTLLRENGKSIRVVSTASSCLLTGEGTVQIQTAALIVKSPPPNNRIDHVAQMSLNLPNRAYQKRSHFWNAHPEAASRKESLPRSYLGFLYIQTNPSRPALAQIFPATSF